ncbi:MAG: xanthine dehydrogenase family protein molybdopterin-binding subunit [Synergistaceae bacterium]|jgi:CO/xanthine dehydrogenase Mo-binding subunit|nr:xanthine dehydrogenase family protein molybdopterin-binding subunit [Synergistaceae bacterium]
MTRPEYKYIGKNTVRKDARDIVQGKAKFLDDFSLPGMLVGKSLKSPYPHAEIVRINADKARALEGVHAVLTWEDVDQGYKFGWPPHKPVLGRRVLYVGDAAALVAAETEQIANAAMEFIEVEYKQLTPVYDGMKAAEDGAPQLCEMFKNNIVPPGYPPFQRDGPFWHLVRGDVEKGFEECGYIAEDVVSFDKKAAPLSPEPPGCIVNWEGDLTFTVYATSQSTFILKIINGTVIPGININAKTFNVGGSYGNKQSLTVPTIYGALLSMAARRPVRYFETKVEQMIIHETRLGSQVRAKIGMDENGVVKAVKALWFVDTGSHCNATQGQVGVGIGEAQLVMAKCPNWDLDTNIVLTNKLPAGIVRGYGGQELNSCLALLIGRTMREGNFDPIECFKKNYVSAGDEYTWRDGRRWRATGVNYVNAIEASAAKFGWREKWKGWGIPTSVSEDGRYARGVGCGIIGNADVGEDQTECYVRIVPDMADDTARVVMQLDITESGMGQRSNTAKMVAEVLNIPYERIELTPPDSLVNPSSMGLCGSRGTITSGRAVTEAALDAKRQLFALAEPFLEVPPDFMELRDYGVGAISRPGKWVSWKRLIPPFLTLTGYGKHLENFSTPNFFIVLLEVEVDKLTGRVRVVKMLGGTDAGQVIDPATLEMQCQGGIGSASLDTAIFEENIIDLPTGRPLTYNMIEYKWRTFNELPEFDTVMLSSQFDTFLFKAVGVGEISGGAAASACMSAISNAIGVEVKEYPATPAVILKAMGRL